MINDVPMSVRFADEFEKELYRLSKKYRQIKKDIKPVIDQIQQGIFLGDCAKRTLRERLIGFGADLYIYKVRVKNSNIQKGKSAGYRLIYLWESETSILLLTIYSKSEREDISTNEIEGILSEYLTDN